MSKRHFWKKNPDNFLNLDLFSKNDAYSVPEKKNSKIHDHIPRKKVWIFSRNDAYSFPKKRFFEFKLDFFPRMTLTHFPTFGFFFQDSRIGVN